MNTARTPWVKRVACTPLMRMAGVALCLVATPAFAPLVQAASYAAQRPAPSDTCAGRASNVGGWFLGGDPAEYTHGRVRGAAPDGAGAMYLKERVAVPGSFATVMQHCAAIAERRKRLRFSAEIKPVGVVNWAGLWMRVDGSSGMLRFDNMGDRPIQGTLGWWRYSVVLDVPANSSGIFFGVLLTGPGTVWIAHARLDAVGRDVPVTGGLAHHPRNLDFAQGLAGWFLIGDYASDYAQGTVAGAAPGGGTAVYLRSRVPAPRTFATTMREVAADAYRGHRVRLSAMVKAVDIIGWAGLWMRVDGPSGVLHFDNMFDRSIQGTLGWRRYSVVLDVPRSARDIAFGLLLTGNGQAWLAHVALTPVGRNVAVTG